MGSKGEVGLVGWRWAAMSSPVDGGGSKNRLERCHGVLLVLDVLKTSWQTRAEARVD